MTQSKKVKKIKMTLEMSPEMFDRIERLAGEIDSSKSEALRRAIALLEHTIRAKREGNKVGVIGADQKMRAEFVVL